MASYTRVLIRKSIEEPTPFWSDRIAFLDSGFLNCWRYDFHNFETNPEAFEFYDQYVNLVNGMLPEDLQTKKKWLIDVDHLYGALQVGTDHWVAYHVDLRKEKIDCYDSIIRQVTPESTEKVYKAFQPLLEMMPRMLDKFVPHDKRKPTGNTSFTFRWMDVKHVPQNYIYGDCGVFTLKFIECLALGVVFYGINDTNVQGIRAKMAVDLFEDGGSYKPILKQIGIGT